MPRRRLARKQQERARGSGLHEASKHKKQEQDVRAGHSRRVHRVFRMNLQVIRYPGQTAQKGRLSEVKQSLITSRQECLAHERDFVPAGTPQGCPPSSPALPCHCHAAWRLDAFWASLLCQFLNPTAQGGWEDKTGQPDRVRIHSKFPRRRGCRRAVSPRESDKQVGQPQSRMEPRNRVISEPMEMRSTPRCCCAMRESQYVFKELTPCTTNIARTPRVPFVFYWGFPKWLQLSQVTLQAAPPPGRFKVGK